MQQQFPNFQELQEDFEYSAAQKLGEGTFGKVYKCKAVKSLPLGYYALKVIETNSDKSYEVAIQELNLNQLINYHENVIRIFKVYSWVEQSPFKKYMLVLAMELAQNSLKGELEERKQKRQRFDDNQIIDIMNQCLKAFDFLAREKHLFHRDIKPENIMLSSKAPYLVKIADFGASKENQHGMLNTLVGTPLFLSPKLQVAYVNNQPGKVIHHLEKSDVFSLGITFLQLLLLLSERELMKLNDPLIFDDVTGDAIDCSENPGLLQQCPGWIKLQGFVNQLQNPNIKACIYGMTQFSEKNRFTWLEALKVLNPGYVEEDQSKSLRENKAKQAKQFEQMPRALKHYSNGTIQLKYFGTLFDQVKHRAIISGGNQIVSYSKEGIRTISLTGQSEQIYNQNVTFLCYLEQLNIVVGINGFYEIFAVNLKNKNFISEKITNFVADWITCMKYMRKDMCLLGNKRGEIFILAFDTQPPQVLKKYKEVDSMVIDLIYDDEFKQIISSHDNRTLLLKSLVNQYTNTITLDAMLINMQLITSEYFCGIAQDKPEIWIFHTFEGSLEKIRTVQTNTMIPQSLIIGGSYLVWTSDSYIGACNYSCKIKDDDGQDLITAGLKKSCHLIFVADDGLIIGSDGVELHRYVVTKKLVDKMACKNCVLQ